MVETLGLAPEIKPIDILAALDHAPPEVHDGNGDSAPGL